MRKSLFALLLIFAMLVTGCINRDGNVSDNETSTYSSKQSAVSPDDSSSEDYSADSSVTIDTSEMFSARDFEVGYDESESAVIQLNGDSAACNSDAVQISGNTITIIDEGTYILSGTLNDGMIIVNSEKSDKTQLVLDGVTIHSETCAPIYILQSDKVFITMAEDSVNTLSNGGVFTAIDENNIDAVIFSKEDVTLNGAGTLIITSPAGHGIVSKDSLKFTSGTYNMNCASHAIVGKDEVCIANADFTIVSGKDGIHAENTDDTTQGYVYIQSGVFSVSAEGDGISASAFMQIEDGSFNITSGGGSENAAVKSSDSWGGFKGGGRYEGGKVGGSMGGSFDDRGKDPDNNLGIADESMGNSDMIDDLADNSSTDDDSADSTSMKGMKAAADCMINGGSFYINSADDAVHSNSSVTVNGGTFEIASGDDAFHADDTLTVTGGTINITESYEGLEGLYVNISGGDITLVSSDDGLNAAGGTDSSGVGGRDGMFGPGNASSSDGSIAISGGTINITASGDGIDANGTIDITGGYIVVSGPTQGDTATLDYDISAVISGGTFIGTGASGMAQTFSDSKQGVISVSAGNQSAGTEIILTDSEGNTVLAYEPELSFSVIILSSPDIVTGETYTITVGSTSGEFTAK